MQQADGSRELRRSPIGRLTGGARLQALYPTVAAVAAIALVGRLSGASGSAQQVVPLLVVLLVAAALTAVGAAGHARVDADGISWRYYLSHRIAWPDVEKVTLAVHSAGVGGVWRTVEIRSHGRTHRVTPARSAGPDRVPFGRDLLAAAADRGIPVEDQWR